MIDAEVRRMLHDGGGDAELGNGTASRRLVAELGGREALSREAAAHMWTAGVVPLSGASLPPGAQEPNPRRLEALHLLYAAYAHLLLATDAIPAVHGEELFWRLCHWGLRQPDPHRPARKIAVALLRHGIACQAAAYISSAAGGAAWSRCCRLSLPRRCMMTTVWATRRRRAVRGMRLLLCQQRYRHPRCHPPHSCLRLRWCQRRCPAPLVATCRPLGWRPSLSVASHTSMPSCAGPCFTACCWPTLRMILTWARGTTLGLTASPRVRPAALA